LVTVSFSGDGPWQTFPALCCWSSRSNVILVPRHAKARTDDVLRCLPSSVVRVPVMSWSQSQIIGVYSKNRGRATPTSSGAQEAGFLIVPRSGNREHGQKLVARHGAGRRLPAGFDSRPFVNVICSSLKHFMFQERSRVCGVISVHVADPGTPRALLAACARPGSTSGRLNRIALGRIMYAATYSGRERWPIGECFPVGLLSPRLLRVAEVIPYRASGVDFGSTAAWVQSPQRHPA
jgi:hypothetical protein